MEVLSGKLAQINAKTPGAFLIPAVTMAEPVALEYYHFWIELLLGLREQGVEGLPLLTILPKRRRSTSPHPTGGSAPQCCSASLRTRSRPPRARMPGSRLRG